MPAEPRARVVVTGIGSLSALGVGGGEVVARALAAAAPALAPVRAFSTAGGPSHLGGEVGDVTAYLDADERRRLPRISQLAVVACRLAVRDAGLEPGTIPGLGLVLGSQWGDFRSSEAFASGFLAKGPLGLSPLVFPSTVMNGMAAHAAIALAARGPMLTLNQAGIAGELAIARGAGLITAGRAAAVLAGGVDELSEILFRELARLAAISPTDASPAAGAAPEGCRPFDRRANGTVAGEGATVLLLESLAAARARGARVYAELAGAAWGNLPAPRHGVPPPRRRDPAVIHRALRQAGAAPDAVGAAYLTGASAPAQDACELDLVAAAFAGRSSRVAAPRLPALTPLAGDHAGLGALRVAGAAAATLGRGHVPALPDLVDPIRADLALAREPGPVETDLVLVHGLARGGAHAALVVRRAA